VKRSSSTGAGRRSPTCSAEESICPGRSWTVTGTPEQLADAIEERFRAGVLDVLSLNGIADDRQHDFIASRLLPTLRARGIVKPDYAGTTLRENLGLPAPARTGERVSACRSGKKMMAR
jgi:hypothetical protein